MLLLELAEASHEVAATRARGEKTARLAACIARLQPAEVEIGVAYLGGDLRQRRVGLGYAVIARASAPAAASPTLTLEQVDATFERIAALSGSGSGRQRERELHALLALGTPLEQDFLRRLVLGELRQGALEGVMADAVARAYEVAPSAVRRAAMLSGDLRAVARAAREHGACGLDAFRLQLFQPLQPMLAQTADDAKGALASLGRAAFEYKFDGARVQLHREGDQVRIFSRQLNDVTASVPELVEAALAFPARSFVLDGEAVALREDGRPLSFQTTMKRFGSRLDVARLRSEQALSSIFFDVLHVDGVDLIAEPMTERAAALAALVPEAQRVPRIVTSDAEEADAFVHRALATGHEGVMAKALDAGYEAGRRGGGWLKIKRAHTLDLVVLAADWGSGRRKGYLSNLHLGARGPDGGFVMLGKTFKGMTDKMLAFQTERLRELEIARDAMTVYVRPELVVEVAFDGVQTSTQYPGGVALRFARVKRYREDKQADAADTIETVRAFAVRE